MRTIQTLLASILFVLSIMLGLFLPSCDSSTSPNTNEGQRIGTWMVYDTEAEWIGTGNAVHEKLNTTTVNAEGDTIFFDNPDGNAVMITYRGEKDNFGLTYIDSSYTGTTSDFDMLTANPFMKEHFISIGLREDHIEVSTGVKKIICDSTYSNNENLVFSYWHDYHGDNKELLKTVSINATGIVDAAKTLKGCN